MTKAANKSFKINGGTSDMDDTVISILKDLQKRCQ